MFPLFFKTLLFLRKTLFVLFFIMKCLVSVVLLHFFVVVSVVISSWTHLTFIFPVSAKIKGQTGTAGSQATGSSAYMSGSYSPLAHSQNYYGSGKCLYTNHVHFRNTKPFITESRPLSSHFLSSDLICFRQAWPITMTRNWDFKFKFQVKR